MAESLKITLVRSTIGEKPKIRATVESLGLRKINSTTLRPDTPDVRGMVFRAQHLLEVEEVGWNSIISGPLKGRRSERSVLDAASPVGAARPPVAARRD